jgi:hypothetical protein
VPLQLERLLPGMQRCCWMLLPLLHWFLPSLEALVWALHQPWRSLHRPLLPLPLLLLLYWLALLLLLLPLLLYCLVVVLLLHCLVLLLLLLLLLLQCLVLLMVVLQLYCLLLGRYHTFAAWDLLQARADAQAVVAAAGAGAAM